MTHGAGPGAGCAKTRRQRRAEANKAAAQCTEKAGHARGWDGWKAVNSLWSPDGDTAPKADGRGMNFGHRSPGEFWADERPLSSARWAEAVVSLEWRPGSYRPIQDIAWRAAYVWYWPKAERQLSGWQSRKRTSMVKHGRSRSAPKICLALD